MHSHQFYALGKVTQERISSHLAGATMIKL